MGSIVISTTSPGQRNFGGLKPIPTPSGVPVAMISPGSNVMPEERVEISLATEKIKSVVFLPVCQAFYDHPMPYTYLPHLPFHHT